MIYISILESLSIDSKNIYLKDNEWPNRGGLWGDYFNIHSLIPIGKGKCGEA